MQIEKRLIKSNLPKKGFVVRQTSHHLYFDYTYQGKGRGVSTHISRGSKPKVCNDYLIGKMKRVNLFSEGGIYIEKGYAFECDKKRVQAVVEKIVKGLYLHEKGFSLNKQCCVANFALNPTYYENTMEGILLLPIKKIGDGKVFLYRYLLHPKDPNITVWFLVFFEKILITATTGILDGGKLIKGKL